MTKFNNYVPKTPKTYEVKYVDLKEPSFLSKAASYLGMKTAENCSASGCPYPNVNFDVSLSIDGNNRSWGR